MVVAKPLDSRSNSTPDSSKPWAEELANILTHGAGALLALAGLLGLIIASAGQGSTVRVVTLSVYAATLLLLYSTSTCYHAFSHTRWRRALRSADHAAIYLLIAGTYTPFMLAMVGGAVGISIVIVLWSLAATGAVLKIFFVGRFAALSTAMYLLMGWTALFALRPIVAHLSRGCIEWLLAGGFLYSAGVIFYVWKRLPFNHAIWHLFVLAGSVAHFVAVAKYVLPLQG